MNAANLAETLALHARWLKDGSGARANLKGADLMSVDLEGANLTDADLGYADLTNADLGYANLMDANLGGANLMSADLRYADLTSANLRGANLRGASLRNANLMSADLRGADLRGADLDFSSGIPLWCGGSDFKADDKVLRQCLAHLCSIEFDSPSWKRLRETLLPEALKSHFANDLNLR